MNKYLYLKAIDLIKENDLISAYAQQRDELKRNDFTVTTLDIGNNIPLTPIETGYVDLSLIEKPAIELIAFNVALGAYPVVYEGENNRILLRNVCPRIKCGEHISSLGSSFDFYPHVDNPDLPITGEESPKGLGKCPDTLSLLSLRHQDDVFTSLLRLDDVLENLTEQEINLLSQPIFIINRPDSFEQNKSSVKNKPILSNFDGKFFSRFDYHNVDTKNQDGLNVLNKLRKIVLNEKLWIKLCLQPGEVITFNNQRTLHTRNKFTPKFDGYDRWLLRLFGLWNKPNKEDFVSKTCEHNLKTN